MQVLQGIPYKISYSNGIHTSQRLVEIVDTRYYSKHEIPFTPSSIQIESVNRDWTLYHTLDSRMFDSWVDLGGNGPASRSNRWSSEDDHRSDPLAGSFSVSHSVV